jgi:uncharacterized protein with PQ loop repeat
LGTRDKRDKLAINIAVLSWLFYSFLAHNVSAYSISIVGRGEEIIYEEDDRSYCFEIFLGRQPLQLFAAKYWTGSVPVAFYELSDSEKQHIIPRLVNYLGSYGEKVEVVWKK